MRRTRTIACRELAVWAAMPLVAVLIIWPTRQVACAAPPHVSSFAPQPVAASTAPLEAVLPPSPPTGNMRPAAMRVAMRHTDAPVNVPAPFAGPVASDAGALPYTPTTAELTSQLLPAVQRGYALAQRGALYAAETEFVQVLRRVAQAKDAVRNSEDHSRALAAGLRALDEAADFAPQGMQLEAEVNVWLVASSHRTPVLEYQADHVSLHEASALYHAFAERQLAWAVAGEQTGSMALHGLGKINARLADLRDNDMQHVRTATAMFSAALAARPDNHLAANELGVLLCKNGRPGEAARLFERAIDFAPTATSYHNLAVAQRKLGMHGQSAANEHEAQRLAALERAAGAVSQRVGVRWVAPGDMARAMQPSPLAPRSVVAEAPRESPWKKTLEAARSLQLPRIERPNFAPWQSSDDRVTPAFGAPPLPGQPQIR
jgi:tetratricopeptide (TPR) repeat protein